MAWVRVSVGTPLSVDDQRLGARREPHLEHPRHLKALEPEPPAYAKINHGDRSDETDYARGAGLETNHRFKCCLTLGGKTAHMKKATALAQRGEGANCRRGKNLRSREDVLVHDFSHRKTYIPMKNSESQHPVEGAGEKEEYDLLSQDNHRGQQYGLLSREKN